MGELLVIFNETMSTNISNEYIQSSMKMWVEPANGREFENGYNQSSIIFGWNVTEFKDKTMKIKLSFNEPL